MRGMNRTLHMGCGESLHSRLSAWMPLPRDPEDGTARGDVGPRSSPVGPRHPRPAGGVRHKP